MDGDIAIVWDTSHGSLALNEDGDDLLTDAGLETAVLISLFTDNRAGDDDELPATETDKRGWWGGEIGSKLWLLRREKQLASVMWRAKEYAQEALQWFVDDGVASSVRVTASNPRMGWLWLDIEIRRPDQTLFHRKYNYNWLQQEYKRVV